MPATPGDAEDLAGADLEVDAADDLVAAVVVDRQALDLEDRAGRVGRRRGRPSSETSRPTISSARSSSFGLGRDPLADDLAAPDDRDPVGDLEDLVELVADEDDAVALGREAAQDGEDLLGLLRRQDGRRLVEDEDPGLAVERLEDLDPLLPADRQRADLGVGVDLEAEPPAELDDPPLGLLAVEEDRVGHRLFAEDDVLGDGEDRDEHEVLVDHADAAGDGVGRAGQVDLLPSSRISPSSGRASPYRTFIRVVLPAPFSPSRAWISPGRTSRSMPSLATTPG